MRACVATDLPIDGAPWLVPDVDLAEGHSLVEEHAGRVVAAGLRRRTRSTNAFDGGELFCLPGHGAAVLRALIAADERSPVGLRVLPGSATAAAVAEVGGAEVLQRVPAGAVPTGHADVLEWARGRLEDAEQAGVELRPGTELAVEELLDLWMPAYVRMHEHWAPVSDENLMREVFRDLFAGTLRQQDTFVAAVAGHPVAATFMNAYDGVLVPLMIETAPGHPAAETAGAASMAAMIRSVSPRPVEFEGHADEPTYMRILETIPHVAAGDLTPMDFVRI
ncbi:MAG: hypothetical protein DCC50_03390 [Acidobacteria bacterium]|nr:MAG: hypothetical protein DCC50_03390 [Acidobacteriota bacterium]